jgi:circadian clock protein KaiC
MNDGNDAAGRRAATGIPGLDRLLGGGFPVNRVYLVEGEPGTGKTTLSLQFLLAGARRGEQGIYVTLSETGEELRDVARSHGWSLDGITICDLQTSEQSLQADSQYTLFHPSEIELSETTRAVIAAVEQVNPARIVFDSLSEMRLLARDPLRYRRQILSLKQYFASRQCTMLLLDYPAEGADLQLQSLAHGVLVLEQRTADYGGTRRRVRIQKLRGVKFRDGYHDCSINTGGLVVYPRLVAAEHAGTPPREPMASGARELDKLLGGGLERGSSAILLGPSGVGKSTLAAQYVAAAAALGERAAVYLFEESPESWLFRNERLGLRVGAATSEGQIELRRVDPAERSPGEFAEMVSRSVEEEDVRLVVIDSVNGYLNAMPHERFSSLHLHQLLAVLAQRGVLTLLVLAEHGLLGQALQSPVDLTYLADAVILLRYFEAFGQVRQAISVLKKRTGNHERSVRELVLGPAGIRIGEELRNFQGVLSGSLVFTGEKSTLMAELETHAVR